jgi:sugar phosphate isomerase/epimerase
MTATLSLSTNIFPPADFLDCLNWCRNLGLTSVEVDLATSKRCFSSRAYRDEIVSRAAAQSISFASMHAWTGNADLMDFCRTAQSIGAGLIVYHARQQALTENFEENLTAIGDAARWCSAQGIIFSVENSSKQPISPLDNLLERVPELGFTLDIRHAWKPRLDLNHTKFLNRFGHRVTNFHINGINEDDPFDLGDATPPGNEPFSWVDLLEWLRKTSYQDLLTIEVCHANWLSPEEMQKAFAEIAGKNPQETTVSHRVARFCVDFFKKQFETIL